MSKKTAIKTKAKKPLVFTRFDAADYLRDETDIAEFLTASLEEPNPAVFMSAVEAVAKARGMAKIAADTGLSRESLYKAFAPGAKPRYETVRRVLEALGAKLTVTTQRSPRRESPRPAAVEK